MRYDVLVWGAGRIGFAAAYDLLSEGYKVVVADVNEAALERVEVRLGADTAKVSMGYEWLVDFRGAVDVVASSLPGPIAYDAVLAGVSYGFNMVDATSLSGRDPRELDGLAREKGVYLVTYAGVAPGMVQVLSGALYRELGGLESLRIYCGGMPQDPTNKPLKTNLTWSPIGYLGMYARKSRKVVNGEIVYVDPLSDVGVIDFPGEGKYEYFLSDGLRSLLFNFKDVPNMAEYSLRWIGHIEQIKLIRDLGLLSEEPIEVDGKEIVPIYFMAKLLGRILTKDPRDKVLTMVVGEVGDDKLVYINSTYYDEERGLTAMQQTTGFNLSRFTMMALDGYLPRSNGANYPEEYGLDENLFNVYVRHMKSVRIKFKR